MSKIKSRPLPSFKNMNAVTKDDVARYVAENLRSVLGFNAVGAYVKDVKFQSGTGTVPGVSKSSEAHFRVQVSRILRPDFIVFVEAKITPVTAEILEIEVTGQMLVRKLVFPPHGVVEVSLPTSRYSQPSA